MVVGVHVEISKEAVEACRRILSDKDTYPGLKLAGDKEVAELFRDDVCLVAETFALICEEIEKHIEARKRAN